jgi:hypothetical protein
VADLVGVGAEESFRVPALGVAEGGEVEEAPAQGLGGVDRFGFRVGVGVVGRGRGERVLAEALGDLLGVVEGGEPWGEFLEGSLLGGFSPGGLFLALDAVPLLVELVEGDLAGLFAEDMGVASDQFLTDGAGDVLDVEPPRLGGDLGVEEDGEEKVAEFLAEVFVVLAVDGLEDLGSFLDQAGEEGSVGLGAVPGAALRSAEVGDRIAEGLQLLHARTSPCPRISYL